MREAGRFREVILRRFRLVLLQCKVANAAT
jgi:hypothetical protein